MKKKRKIRRGCKCGCGLITNPGNKYINGHNTASRNIGNIYGKGNIGKIHVEKVRKNMSLGQMGNTNALGFKHTKETKKKMSLVKQNISKKTKLKMALGKIKFNPNYEYGCEWYDKEYKDDIRKDYCENKDCKKISKRLVNHHIYLDKKRCAPNEVMTLCNSCHMWLHRALQNGKTQKVNPKDFIIINRIDHVSYINKITRKIIRIEKFCLKK